MLIMGQIVLQKKILEVEFSCFLNRKNAYNIDFQLSQKKLNVNKK